MNPVFRMAGIAVLGIATMVAAAGIVSPGKASAAGTDIDCYFHNGLQWQCDISNPDGISHVNLTWETGFAGDIELWDQSYASCPTKVTIGSWGDEVAGDFDFDVEICSGLNLADPDRSDLPRGDLQLKAGESAGDRYTAQIMLKADARDGVEMCWEAECPGHEIPWELVDPSCYAHELSHKLPWCQHD